MSGRAEAVADTRLSWLCTTEAELQRYFDLDANLNTARRRVIAIVVLPAFIMASSFGRMMWIVAGSAVALAILIEWLRRTLSSTPALGVVTVGGFQLLLTLGVATSGGLRSPWLPWLAIPVMMLACRYRRAVTLTGTAAAVAAAMLACGTAAWANTARDCPDWFYGLSTAALMVAFAVVALTMQTADLESRSAAASDPLTGLPNRKALTDTLRLLTVKVRAADQWLCVLACDLDHFKRVNDTYGHPRGDAVLAETARRLQSSLREKGTIFRVGGEEFIAVLPGVDPETGSHIAERLRRAVSAAPVAQLEITVSVGVAAQRGGSVDTDALLASADAALYTAKKAGRDVVRVA
jgi:diguanylate cyclase (GGDEF)-like protein